MKRSLSAKQGRSLGVSVVSLAIAAGAGGLGAWAFARQPEPPKAQHKEETMKLADIPEPVRAALAKVTPADKVTKIVKETHTRVTTYEVEYKADGAACSVVFTPAGDLLEMEKNIKQDSLPAAALEALKKKFPDAKFDEITLVEEFYYEVEFKAADGKKHEVELDAFGNIDDDDDDDDDAD